MSTPLEWVVLALLIVGYIALCRWGYCNIGTTKGKPFFPKSQKRKPPCRVKKPRNRKKER